MSEIPAELLDSVRELSSLLISEETLKTALDRVTKLSKEAIPGTEAVGITLVRGGESRDVANAAETAAYSDERVVPIDEAQYETKQGPCLQAIQDNETFTIDDLEQEQRWPLFREKAFEKGLRSSMSIPLAVGDRTIGALNMYAFTERAFQNTDLGLAKTFAAQAAISLANVQVYESAVQLSEHLSEAMKTRAVIEQAKGMIMLERHCSADEAFETLVAASQSRNKKLRDIAQEVVEAASTADGDGKSRA